MKIQRYHILRWIRRGSEDMPMLGEMIHVFFANSQITLQRPEAKMMGKKREIWVSTPLLLSMDICT